MNNNKYRLINKKYRNLKTVNLYQINKNQNNYQVIYNLQKIN